MHICQIDNSVWTNSPKDEIEIIVITWGKFQLEFY